MSRWLLIFGCSLVVCAAACKEKNSEYCTGHPNDTVNCPPDAGSGCTHDDQCSGKVCDTASGACVVCTPSKAMACTGTTPVCSSIDTCVPCTMHSQCTTSNVCLPDGSCSDGTNVAYVAGTGSGTACTQAMPCNTLAAAVATNKPYIKIAAGLVKDNVTTTIDGKNVTILAEHGAKLDRDGDGPILVVQSANADVKIYDLEITGATGVSGADAVQLTPNGGMPKLALTRVTIDANQGTGVFASGGALTMTQSTVTGNTSGGISITNGSFDITNNFVTRNGDPNNATVGGASLTFAAAGTNRFEFNTVVDNNVKNTSLQAAGVTCDTSGFAAANNIVSRNFVGNDPAKTNSNTLGQCTYPTSAIGPTITALKFASADATPYNYHLTSGSSAIDQATTPASVAVDFDGDARPQGPASDQGADEYK